MKKFQRYHKKLVVFQTTANSVHEVRKQGHKDVSPFGMKQSISSSKITSKSGRNCGATTLMVIYNFVHSRQTKIGTTRGTIGGSP